MTDPSPRVLISATIAAGVDGVFAVALDQTPSLLAENETFRFALHYYGRVLYELARARRSVRPLTDWTNRIAATAVDRDIDFFSVADVKGALVGSLARPLAAANVAFRTAGLRDREVSGDLAPLRGSFLPRSVLAVFQAVIPRLSEPMCAAIPAALANMNASYQMTHRYADADSPREVPAVAYRAASFV